MGGVTGGTGIVGILLLPFLVIALIVAVIMGCIYLAKSRKKLGGEAEMNQKP